MKSSLPLTDEAAMNLALALPDQIRVVTSQLKKPGWYRVEGNADGPDYLIRVKKTADNRLICTGLVVGLGADEREITARKLRGVKLGDIMTELLEWHAVATSQGYDPTELVESAAIRPARPGPKGLTENHFRRVAAAYERALIEHPRKPVKTVAAEMHAEEVTVRRWIKRAREMKFIASETEGRATK